MVTAIHFAVRKTSYIVRASRASISVSHILAPIEPLAQHTHTSQARYSIANMSAPQPPPTPLGPGSNIKGPEVPVTPTPGMEAIHANQQGSASSYFPSVDSGPVARERAAQTPGTALASHNAEQKMDATVSKDPKSAFPGLALTGSVISATFCVPYSLAYNGSNWVSDLDLGVIESYLTSYRI